MGVKYDFSGWATKANILCSDGRVIAPNAFKDCDGKVVPLVWNHDHNDPEHCLGHALLDNRGDGVYAYCSLNNSRAGKHAKELIRHGDVESLSIYANKLTQNGSNVVHGMIREVSLVLAGANPEACIDCVLLHADGEEEDAIIYNGLVGNVHLAHSEDGYYDEEEEMNDEEMRNDVQMGEVYDNMSEDKLDFIDRMIAIGRGEYDPDEEMEHSDEDDQDIIDSMTDEEAATAFAIINEAVNGSYEDDEDEDADDEYGEDYEDADDEYGEDYEDADDEYGEEGDDTMGVRHNVFENENPTDTLSHSDMMAVIDDCKRMGSMREAFLAHGITNVGNLFPDAKALNNEPYTYGRDVEWVSKVMAGVHRSPFSRVKSTYIDITADEARARGYVKGNQKVEEVIVALKRVTTPTTVYKLQKMDRDDYLDITDFDAIAYLKKEMRRQLDEECARAYLVGDGRSTLSNDHIDTLCIRPIWTDDATYTIRTRVTAAANDTDDKIAKAIIRAAILARKDYKGKGNCTFFTTEDYLNKILLMEDGIGRPLYDTVDKVATALRVKEIVTVPVMEGLTRVDTTDNKTVGLVGIIVNMDDYNVGTDRHGEVSLFDDFDLNYNKMEYLIETRCSAALVNPKSAIAIEFYQEPAVEESDET